MTFHRNLNELKRGLKWSNQGLLNVSFVFKDGKKKKPKVIIIC